MQSVAPARVHNPSLDRNNLHFILAGAILLFIVFFVAVTNNQATYSFTIKRLESEQAALRDEIRRLTWEAGQARSLAVIQRRARELSLSPAAAVSFLSGPPAAVALSAALLSPSP